MCHTAYINNLNLFQNIHKDLKLSGEPLNGLLFISQDIFVYLLALLWDETPTLPEATSGEWNKALSILECHGIIPLLYWKIAQLPGNIHPPEEITGRMRQIFLANRTYNLRQEKQLQEILEGFQKEKIQVLLIKGLALSRMVYPDPVVRPSNDIDLLVHPISFMSARQQLESLGYRCTGKKFEMAWGFYYEEKYRHKTDRLNNLEVDLHWRLDNNFKFNSKSNIDELFNGSTEIVAQYFYFNTLNPVDTLIHLSFHLIMGHCRNMRLVWIYDIALIAKGIKQREDWEHLQEKSLRCNALLPVENALKLAQAWCGLKLPYGLDDFSIWPAPHKEDVVTFSRVLHRHRGVANQFLLHWPASATLWAKIKFLFYLFFPNPGHFDMSPDISMKLLLLAYTKRCWRWLVKLIRG